MPRASLWVRWSLVAALIAAGTVLLAAAPKTSLQIGSVGNDLKFDKERLSAAVGAKVTVTLKNNATSKGLDHNWVLVRKGSEEAVANAGLNAGAKKGYVAKGDPNVLANTKLVKARSSGKVKFTAPAAGIYSYICTFPGHAATMHGVFEVP